MAKSRNTYYFQKWQEYDYRSYSDPQRRGRGATRQGGVPLSSGLVPVIAHVTFCGTYTATMWSGLRSISKVRSRSSSII